MAVGSLKPSGRAERIADGFRVTGKWGFGSGIRHADWMVANCLTQEEKPQGVSLVIPVGEVEILDDWHVAGLCGTGSCSYAVADVQVPARRAIHGPQRRGSFFNAKAGLRIPIEHASVSLGGARRVLDETIRLSATKRRLLDPATVVSKQSFQVELGKLEAQWATLLAGVRACAGELWECAEHQPDAIDPAAEKLKAVCAHATEQSLAIGGRAFRYAGAGAIHDVEALQRVYRDLVVSAQHAMVADSAYGDYAKVALAGTRPP